MGKRITCYHPGCPSRPTKELRVNKFLSVAYCDFHYAAALRRKRHMEVVGRIMRGEKT